MYKLIIIEDEELIRKGLKEQMPWEEYGFELIGEADNGKTALELISSISPDVILVDIMIPLINGIELISMLNETNPHIKVVVLSGYSEFDYAKQCIEHGIFAYLLKPIKKHELEQTFLKIKRELDLKNNINNEIEMIKRSMETSLPIIKSKLIDDLLGGNISRTEFLKWSSDIEELNITSSSRAGVILIQIFYAEGKYQLDDITDIKIDLLKLINQHQADYFIQCLDILLDKPSILCLVTSCNTELSKENYINITVTIKKLFNDFFNSLTSRKIELTLGVGRLYDDAFKLKDSYQEALQSLAYKFFTGRGTINHILDISQYSKDKNIENCSSQMRDTFINELIEAVIQCNIGELLRLLDVFFDSITHRCCDYEEFIFTKLVEFMLLIAMRLSEFNIDFKNVYDKNIQLSLKQIIETGTIYELRKWLADICFGAIHLINDSLKDTRADPLIDKVKSYIMENYDKKITLESICEEVFISPSYFCTFFKQKTNSTFIHYLTSFRIDKAKKLLLKSDLKVYEIAVKVGYDNFRYFSKVFKKFEGMNPMDYRKQMLLSLEADSKGEK